MKKTFEELKEIDILHGKLRQIEGFDNTKFGYCFKKFSDKNIVKAFKEFNEILEDVRIDNALTDKKTAAILYKPNGQFEFGKEGLKNVLKKSKELENKWNSKLIEVIPFICKEIPDTVELLDEEKDLIDGVIINLKEKK